VGAILPKVSGSARAAVKIKREGRPFGGFVAPFNLYRLPNLKGQPLGCELEYQLYSRAVEGS
jgi:hypothetical protein